MGRTTIVTCNTFAKYDFEADPKIILREADVVTKIGDKTGTGWSEFCWSRDYLEFVNPSGQQFQP